MRLTLEEVTLNHSDRKEFSHLSDLLCQEQKELIEYKTLEDELGIDLITLFKTKTVWCETLLEDIKTKERSYQIIERKLWGVNLEYKEIMVGSQYSFGSYKINDYGKTWALTKEELL